jgi:hypothetical protein
VTSFLHPRPWLALTLAMVWVAAAASADVVLTPGMHCRDMPCCPRSDGGMQSCSTAQCAEQVPEKAEGQSAPQREPKGAALIAIAAVPDGAAGSGADARPERMPGLRSSAAVFRLKDDLRI